MPLSHLIRVPLLLLFVLLQCVAPLAHAHINNGHGESDGQGVHIDMVESTWLNDHDHESDPAHLSVGEHHSAVVCMPPEYRSNALVFDQPAIASIHGMFVPREHVAVIAVDFYPPPLSLTPFQHPSSQAPPVKYS